MSLDALLEWGAVRIDLVVVEFALLVVVLVLGYLNAQLRRDDVDDGRARRSTSEGSRRSTTDESSHSTDGTETDSVDESESGWTDVTDAFSANDAERLGDEERVYRLVEANGGNMRQADIVARCPWSKAKVSRLLSQLERENRIRKVQLGRENRIYLRGHEPAACRSPFDRGDDGRTADRRRGDESQTDDDRH